MNMPTPKEEALFFAALELPEAERAAFLRESCGEDSVLRKSVESLLTDHREATVFFTETAERLVVPKEEEPPPELVVGAQIGPYRILRLLGEGGGGLVYEAEQEVPVRRRVAIKLLKAGVDQRRVIARFEAERHTLALMEHPNIARVLDAGTSDGGRPYFVMELVHGTRITEYCLQHRLTLEQRLQLLRQVCLAVQHAHQKGVIHHDLKPSNLLVSEIDGLPVPKIIDFGVARALDTAAGGWTEPGQQGQLVGTPAYMSPEQFQSGNLDVDTRSDIYSLGVVLYELVAGRPPFDNKDLLAAGLDELRGRILGQTPLPPSRLGAEVRFELDCIVMKALEKDRERRYSTVRALSVDLEHYLAHRPVEAHPPSAWYRLGKLVRRNRLVSLALLVAAVALLGGFSTSTLLYLRAKEAERQQIRLRAEAEEREHVTKAAILLMQNRTEEADAEIRRMGGILTQPSVEASHVFHTLGLWSAMNGDWKTSSARWLALSRVNRFDDRDMTDNATRDLLPVAPTLLEAGDVAAFQEFREVLIRRLGKTNNPIAAEQVLKICLNLPAPPETLASMTTLVEVAERSLPGTQATPPRDWLEAWRCIALGLWHLRNGRAEASVHWCDRALLLQDEEESRRCLAKIIRGLARRRAGVDDPLALADLREAATVVEQRFARRLDYGTGGYWHDWLSARLLLREAGFTSI